MSSKLVLVGGLFIGAALAVLYWPSQRNPAPVTPTPEHRQPPVAPTPKTKPEPVKAQVAPPAKAPTSPVTKVTPKPGNDVSADRIRLPDGTSVPVLNGAYGAPAMPWRRCLRPHRKRLGGCRRHG